MNSQTCSSRRGICLSEMIIAILLLGLTLLMLGTIIAAGNRHALRARQHSTAVLLAQSKMENMLALTLPAVKEEAGAFESDFTGYRYVIHPTSCGEGLQLVEVTVSAPCGASARMSVLRPAWAGIE